jgi:hypothetical protein
MANFNAFVMLNCYALVLPIGSYDSSGWGGIRTPGSKNGNGVIRQFVAMPLGGEIVELADRKRRRSTAALHKDNRVVRAHKTRPCCGVMALASTDQ